jgi:metal-responsive CopG/Arc/MetJ family transcriptional regulator
MSETTRINVFMPTKLYEGTKRLATMRGTNASEIFRTALREYIVDQLRKEKETNAELSNS